MTLDQSLPFEACTHDNNCEVGFRSMLSVTHRSMARVLVTVINNLEVFWAELLTQLLLNGQEDGLVGCR